MWNYNCAFLILQHALEMLLNVLEHRLLRFVFARVVLQIELIWLIYPFFQLREHRLSEHESESERK